MRAKFLQFRTKERLQEIVEYKDTNLHQKGGKQMCYDLRMQNHHEVREKQVNFEYLAPTGGDRYADS
jgi:hypothetical protein